jgi:AraC family transcriptional activator of pobA
MTESCIQVVPALCIHGFHFSPGTQGFVLSLALPLLSRFENQFGRPLDVLSVAQCLPVGRSGGVCIRCFQRFARSIAKSMMHGK